MTSVNLIPAYRREAQARKAHLARLVGIMAAYCLALLVGFLVCARYAGRGTQDLGNDTRRAVRQVESAKNLVSALAREVAAAQRQLRTAEAVGQQPDWSGLFAILAGNLGESVVLDGCRLQPGGPDKTARPSVPPSPPPSGAAPAGGQLTVEVSGLAKAQSDVSDYMLRLEKTGLFDKVRLIRTNRQAFLNDKVLAFQLECIIQGGEGAPQ